MLVVLASAGARHHGFWEALGGILAFAAIFLLIFAYQLVREMYRTNKQKLSTHMPGRVLVGCVEIVKWFRRVKCCRKVGLIQAAVTVIVILGLIIYLEIYTTVLKRNVAACAPFVVKYAAVVREKSDNCPFLGHRQFADHSMVVG